MYTCCPLTLRHKVWGAQASLMLNVLTVTVILFTGIFIILIIANLPQPAAAAPVCSLSLCCRTSRSEMANGAGPVAALRSA